MAAATVTTAIQTVVVSTPREAAPYLARMQGRVYFDIETTGLNPRRDKLVSIQLRCGTQTVILDCRDDLTLAALVQGVADRAVLVGHNLKFDLQFLLVRGVKIDRVYDTMIAEQVIHGVGMSGAREAGIGLNLKDTAARYGVEVHKEERNWFIELDGRVEDWAWPFPDDQVAYMAQDVEVLGPIVREQEAEMAVNGLREVFDLEMRALPAIARMECVGIRIDVVGWRAFIAEKTHEAKGYENTALEALGGAILAARIKAYDAEVRVWQQTRDALKHYEETLREAYDADPAGEPWGEYKQRVMAQYRAEHTIPAKPKLALDPPNIGSQVQLLAAFAQLGIPIPTKRNDRGERVPTTDSDNLEKLAPQYPAIRSLLDWRKANKFVDSFGESLLQFAEAESEEVSALHPDYQQIGADTGRKSCSRPNFQQIPAQGDGEKVRDLVRARPGRKLLTGDFSNIELRILADLSGDAKMLEMFASGQDLHAYTAKLLFKLPMEWSKDQVKAHKWRGMSARSAAKIVNFLIPYGGSAFALAMQNDIPVEAAEELVNGWFGMFSGADSYLKGLAKGVHKTLHSRTVAGRWRKYKNPGPEPSLYAVKLPSGKPDYAKHREALEAWKKRWAAIERQARNTPIQGSSADITKLAVALFHERCPRNKGALVAVVHDELVVEAVARYAEEVAAIQADVMVEACRRYLKRVTIPRPEINIGEVWHHD